MKLAHNIVDEEDYQRVGRHSNYNSIQQIIDCQEPIGFDGIYRNVYENQSCLENKSGILFVMGDFVGKNNSFDLAHVPRLEQYCDWDEIMFIIKNYNFTLGWHTWSHPDLTTLSREEIMREITPPVPMYYFAYPYGRYNDLVVECVKLVGYKAAWSVTQGSTNPNENDYIFKQYRSYL